MDIDTLVENHFKKNRDIYGFDSIIALVEEVMESMDNSRVGKILLEKMNTPTSESFDWNSIPEIPISELGWSDTRTKEVGGPQGGQRKLLEDYLKNIQGADIPDKLKSLNDFMANPDIEGDTPGDKISKILGYLVFYKTLTRVITNFNASSAGFSFESFLAVLTGGEQISTGEGTIADFQTADGEFVSLKLYQEGSVEVGGSWQDLVDDLANDSLGNRMTYIVVLKDLNGEGLDQEGTLKFYRFTITLDNVASFIDKSATKSRDVIILPLTPEGELVDLAAAEPEAQQKLDEAIQRTKVSAEDFNKLLADTTAEALASLFGKVPELAPLADKTAELVDYGQLGGTAFGKLASSPSATELVTSIFEIYADVPEADSLLRQRIQKGRGGTTIEMIGKILLNSFAQAKQQLKKDPEAARAAAGENLLKKYIKVDKNSIARSIAYYNGLVGNPEQQKKALFSSYGYLTTKHFAVGKGVATGKVKVTDPEMPVQFMGQINIGASQIAPILEQARGELNDQVYGIFRNLKTLSTEINAYFASGLQDAKAGAEASRASKDIASTTEEVTSQKK